MEEGQEGQREILENLKRLHHPQFNQEDEEPTRQQNMETTRTEDAGKKRKKRRQQEGRTEHYEDGEEATGNRIYIPGGRLRATTDYICSN